VKCAVETAIAAYSVILCTSTVAPVHYTLVTGARAEALNAPRSRELCVQSPTAQDEQRASDGRNTPAISMVNGTSILLCQSHIAVVIWLVWEQCYD
jgi:hypothetical protein